jgi:hypothetical protein
LLRTTSARELAEWQIFERLEPWGDEWRQVALICAELWNVQGGIDGERVKPEDIVPGLAEPADADEETPEQSIEELNCIFAAGGHPVTVEHA